MIKQNRYLGEGKEFWVEDFPDTSIAALKLYMGQKVKFVCELMQQCTSPAWKVCLFCFVFVFVFVFFLPSVIRWNMYKDQEKWPLHLQDFMTLLV